MQNKALKLTFEILGFLWLLPATILVWLFYVLPLWALGEIKYEGKAATFIWVFENPISSSWYDKKWKKWAGWAGPCVYIYKKYTPDMFNRPVSSQELKMYEAVTRTHEVRHCVQQFLFGVFHYPFYFLSSAYIVISNLWKKQKDRKHAHLDNIFEVDARKAAGQQIYIPQERWPDGPNDYNPWF